VPGAEPAKVAVSVVVRSFKRAEALKELVGRLGLQSHPSFEVVILEQSEDQALVRDLEALGDSRIRVVVSAPLNPPAARNEAVRHTKGEILILIDDDDLPIGTDWIDRHLANFADPLCMGVVGRLQRDPDRAAAPAFPRFVRLLAMRHTLFKDSRGLAHNTLRKKDIDFLIGSNVSIRRSLLDRIGGWDEGIPINEEQSFAFKFHLAKRPGEHFTYDPVPTIWRRTDIPGGLNRRFGADWYLRELDAWLFYFRHVVAHYFPLRYRLLYPLFLLRAIQKVSFWIWDEDNSHRPVGERITANVELFTRLPQVLRSSRFAAEKVRRVPRWD
jgi:glycosyltransferase involved in cell wall biosynthesis